MASQDEMDVFNERTHRKVGDIVVIGGDVNLYEVTSTLDPENKIKGIMFNLTHFIKNFKKYIKLSSNPGNSWGVAACMEYENYIRDFINLIYKEFPEGGIYF